MFCPHRPTSGANVRLIGLDRHGGKRAGSSRYQGEGLSASNVARQPFFLKKCARLAGEGHNPAKGTQYDRFVWDRQ